MSNFNIEIEQYEDEDETYKTISLISFTYYGVSFSFTPEDFVFTVKENEVKLSSRFSLSISKNKYGCILEFEASGSGLGDQGEFGMTVDIQNKMYDDIRQKLIDANNEINEGKTNYL